MANDREPPPDVGGHGGLEGPRASTSWLNRVFSPQAGGRRRPPARAPGPLSDPARRAQILAIDGTERRIGYAAAIVAAVIAILTIAPYVRNPKSAAHPTVSPIKGKACPTGYHYQKVNGHFTCWSLQAYPRSHWVVALVVVGVFALAVYIAVRIGRRSAVAFTILMTGLALMSVEGTVLAVPFIFVGGWLLVRAWRVQRFGSPTAKRPVAAESSNGTARAPSEGSAARPAKARATPSKGSRRGKPAPAGPAPNKRYTPKTPQRRRPAPPS